MSTQAVMAKIALPYSEALLEYSRENNLIEEIHQNLYFVSEMLSQSIDLKLFLQNPLVTIKAKKNVLNQLLLDKVNTFILKFLLVLLDRRRINLLNAIIDKYFELECKLDSTIIAQVSASIAFTEIQKDTLISKLKEMTNSKQVKLQMNIDPSLIAGFTIQIGSKIIDTSLSGKLKQMAFYLNIN